jgi:hypothetical protein
MKTTMLKNILNLYNRYNISIFLRILKIIKIKRNIEIVKNEIENNGLEIVMLAIKSAM